MAMSVVELEAQRDAIRRAIRSGSRRVRHGEKEIEYRSVAELQAALDDVQAELSAANGVRRSRVRYHTVSKGF